MGFGRAPYSVISDSVDDTLVTAVCDGIVETSTKFVYEVLKDHSSLGEMGAKATFNIFRKLMAWDFGQIFA